MNRKVIVVILFLILPTLVLSACLLPGVSSIVGTPMPEDAVNTAAAKTVSALGTAIAAGNYTPIVGPAEITTTFTVTPTPTLTPVPGHTDTPTPETRAAGCNKATFVSDITIPDGSTVLPKSTFVKTWALKNTGTCSWNSDYRVVFANKGNAMGGDGATMLAINGAVKPGETANVSVELHAPGEPGDYEGYWMLRSSDNAIFGTGANGASPFFVKIHVAEEYSFAEHLCSAKWSSAAGDLPCPGTDGDIHGYALALKNPPMEDNQAREGLGFLMVPQRGDGGYILGRFDPVYVPEHSDFRATISCQPGLIGCSIHFKITYRINNEPEETLGEWNEGSDGHVTEIITDLNKLGGKSAAFYFYVSVSGAPDQAKGVWFAPRILKN